MVDQESTQGQESSDDATVEELEPPRSLPKVTASREPGIKIVGIKNPERGLVIDVGSCDW
jgi:hypothetical protein